MSCHDLSAAGPAGEAEIRSAPISFRSSVSDLRRERRERRLVLERRLTHQTALARFARRALEATALRPLHAEAVRLCHQAFPFPASGAFELLPGDDAGDVALAASVADILRAASGAIATASANHHASLHDPLTGLANRALVLDHLDLALARAGRRTSLVAVIFLDLDDFKPVNDTFGHIAGDELLVQIAERLRAAVRPSDTLGRWGGDEFVVVCEDIQCPSGAPVIVARLEATFDRPFPVGGTELRIGASIGVAVSGVGDDRPGPLIHAADLAMYRDKNDLPGGARL
jgi:diguanylate cyclase (GGDEF)-like protein